MDRGYSVSSSLKAHARLRDSSPASGRALAFSSKRATCPSSRGHPGLGELKTRKRGCSAPGPSRFASAIRIHFGPQETEAAITTRLQVEVERLLGTQQ